LFTNVRGAHNVSATARAELPLIANRGETMASFTDASIVDNIRQSIAFFLNRSGDNSKEALQGMDAFLEQIKPDLYELLAEAAAGRASAGEAVDLFADAAVARVTRLALEFTEQEKLAMASIAAASVRAVLGIIAASA
jgi:hypothetical protein